MEKGHKKLQIYQEAHSLAIRIHKMTLALPPFEKYEQGSQIRRSSKSIPANIVEGFALRKYKKEFEHFLYRSYGSCQETVEHLELLHKTESLPDTALYDELHTAYEVLCAKILRFIQAVDRSFELPHFAAKTSNDRELTPSLDIPKRETQNSRQE